MPTSVGVGHARRSPCRRLRHCRLPTAVSPSSCRRRCIAGLDRHAFRRANIHRRCTRWNLLLLHLRKEQTLGASVPKPHGPALRTDRVARRVRRPALCASRRSAWRHRASAAGSDGGTRRTKATILHACTQWYPVGAAPLLRSYRSAAMRRQVRSTTVVVATCIEETGQNEPVERETRRCELSMFT